MSPAEHYESAETEIALYLGGDGVEARLIQALVHATLATVPAETYTEVNK